jgi:hypothetical protein
VKYPLQPRRDGELRQRMLQRLKVAWRVGAVGFILIVLLCGGNLFTLLPEVGWPAALVLGVGALSTGGLIWEWNQLAGRRRRLWSAARALPIDVRKVDYVNANVRASGALNGLSVELEVVPGEGAPAMVVRVSELVGGFALGPGGPRSARTARTGDPVFDGAVQLTGWRGAIAYLDSEARALAAEVIRGEGDGLEGGVLTVRFLPAPEDPAAMDAALGPALALARCLREERFADREARERSLLVRAREEPHEATRLRCLDALLRFTFAPEVAREALELAQRANAPELMLAAEAGGHVTLDTEQIAAALRSPGLAERREAIGRATQCGPGSPALEAALLALLDGADEWERQHIAAALGEIGAGRAVAALRALEEGADWERKRGLRRAIASIQGRLSPEDAGGLSLAEVGAEEGGIALAGEGGRISLEEGE